MRAISARTPGVYIREIEPVIPRTAATGIAGFVGLAERGPVNFPQLVTSWGQFLEIFGSFTGYSYLAYAVFGFFLNGGERCRVVRVAHESASNAFLDFVNQDGIPALRVRAISEGVWGRSVVVTLEDTSATELDLTGLAAAAAAGATSASFKSVAGMAPRDMITLIHSDDPFIRDQRLQLQTVDYSAGKVTFGRPIASSFPAGSTVAVYGFRLRIRSDSQGAGTREEVFDNLSLNSLHERYFVRVINGDSDLVDFVERRNQGVSVLVQVEDSFAGLPVESARPLPVTSVTLKGGSDGSLDLNAPYYTGRSNGDYFRPVPSGASPAEVENRERKLLGLSALETVSDIETVAIPDLILHDLYNDSRVNVPEAGIVFATPPSGSMQFSNLKLGQQQMLRHCASMGNRFAILDSPRGAAIGAGTAPIEQWPDIFDLSAEATNAALYYPWLRENPQDFGGRDLFIPPCGHVAGLYNFATRNQGLGRAPANEALLGAAQLEFAIDDASQEVLNPHGVNCLRVFPNRGPRLWGARTLSRDPSWRYVSVRRLYLYIVRQIQTSLQTTVFEPNDTRLRQRIVRALTLFFRGLFQDGALAGTRPEEAFFVKCDDETNPPGTFEGGQIITMAGFAPAVPSEFIIVTVTRKTDSVSVQQQQI